jgi:hypothetical protein
LYSSHCIQLEGDENKEQKKQEKTKQKKNDWKNEIILKTTKKGTGQPERADQLRARERPKRATGSARSKLRRARKR